MKRAFIIPVLLLTAVTLAADAPILYARPRLLGYVSNPDIKESSGLAFSVETDGLLWTHNDSGDSPRLFALSPDGAHIAEFRVDAKNRDWEDMACFKVDQEGYLLIADVGDNLALRKSYSLYLLKEPKPRKDAKPGKPEELKPQAEIEFTYPDGPHNCEALAVDASDGKTARAILVTKTDGGTCKVFELDLPLKDKKDKNKGKGKTPLVAKEIGKLTIPTVVAMDISPDGRRAIVLTYGDAYEYTRGEKESWADAFARKPRLLEMPKRQQGETICYGPDGKTLYLTSEGAAAPLWMLAPR